MQADFSKTAFYGVKNKRVLAGLLHFPLPGLKSIAKKRQAHYKEFPLRVAGKKEARLCQVPNLVLKGIQGHIMGNLEQIPMPDSLYSPKKGKSYIDNAAAHKENGFVLKMDITKFFMNCRRKYVFEFFKDRLVMSEDCAWLLTDLVTFSDHLPTGAPTSPIISYWAYSKAFEKIDRAAYKDMVVFTQYVDDLVFSSKDGVSHKLQLKVNRIIKNVGLKINKKRGKTVRFGPDDYKVITGCAISPSRELEPTHSLRKKIFAPLKDGSVQGLDLTVTRQTLGRVRAARAIKPGVYPTLHKELVEHEKALREVVSSKPTD